MSNQRDQDEIRNRLTAFAATIPDHGLNAFGQLVEIETVVCEGVYQVTLETDYEERTLLKREKPDDGSISGLTDHVAIGPDLDVWDTAWNSLVTNKEAGACECLIPGSTTTCSCGQCTGHGAVTCDKCLGQKMLSCPRCQGGWVQCRECSGSGVTKKTRTEKITRECYAYPHDPNPGLFSNCRCRGKGWYFDYEEVAYKVQCKKCNGTGSVQCFGCSGKGAVRCDRCRAEGRLICPHCQGRKQIVSWLAIQQTINRESQAAQCGSGGLSKDDLLQLGPEVSEVAAVLDEKADYEVIVHRDVSTPGSENIPDDLANCAFPDDLKKHVQELFGAAKAKLGPSRRVVKHTIRIQEAKVWAIAYQYAGKAYHCKLVGKTKVLASVSPLSELPELRQQIASLKKGLKVEDFTAWVESTTLGSILLGFVCVLAFLACLLFFQSAFGELGG